MKISDMIGITDPLILERIYMAASLHDIGLSVGRDIHHIESERMVLESNELKNIFNQSDIVAIATACRQHRASSEEIITNIESLVVADADTLAGYDFKSIIHRVIASKLHADPKLTKEDLRTLAYNLLRDKYGMNGYAKFYLKESNILAEKSTADILAAISTPEIFDKEFTHQLKNWRI